jgi:NADPH:quinone reductase-like Zn-dependent oxidoreductase
MKAIVQHEYGPPGVLHVEDIEPPIPKDKEVLLRVAAAAVHVGDWFLSMGTPRVMRLGTGLRRPRKKIPGFDVAGTVEMVGKDVTDVSPGDEVFGEASSGSCAEYATVAAGKLAPKPAGLKFDEAAAIPVSGATALRGIRDAGRTQQGQRVLVNGATGGVGVYAVQIAKALGAEVTAVCSAANADLAQSLGADYVIDYKTEDFTKGDRRYDLILDNVGNRSLAESRQALAADGLYIPNSGRSQGSWFGPLGRMGKAFLGSLFISGQGRPYYSPVTRQDLLDLTEFVDDGKLTPIIDRRYSLGETPAAMGYVATGHARGKAVIVI